METQLEKGTKITVGDIRKDIKDRIIAEGVIYKIEEQHDVKYVYLDTGYYLVIHPVVKMESHTLK